jgi:alanyl-tRNA synthetase
VREASSIIGGGGGGKPNFAQGGGTRTDKLPEALRKAEEILRKELGSK